MIEVYLYHQLPSKLLEIARLRVSARLKRWQKGSTDKTFEPKKMEADTSNSLESIFGRIMPLLRYFTFAGGALFALLMVVSSHFPATETIIHSEMARPVVRIASDRVGPPRVDIDTRVQTPVVPTPVSEAPPQTSARVVEAQLSTPLPTPAAAPAKIQHKKTWVAKRPDRQRMAANPQGFQPFRW
jgi:hypothetical protein